MATLDKDAGAHLPLTRLFRTDSAKVLDFLLTNEGLYYSEDEISKLAVVPARALRRCIRSLYSENVIMRKKRAGQAYEYAANISSPRTAGLIKYVDSTMMDNLNKAAQKVKG